MRASAPSVTAPSSISARITPRFWDRKSKFGFLFAFSSCYSGGLFSHLSSNGSGKSNLLDAVSNVLNPKTINELDIFHNVEQSKAFPSAEIIITCNNEDRRIDISADKVVLHWSIRQKKSTLTLNGKRTTIEEWKTLLKTAGLTRSNYHIIKQGETNKLANASPAQRLAVLKEFAGATDYEKKRQGTLKYIEVSKEEVEKASTELAAFNNEIAKLNEEHEELQKFRKVAGFRAGLLWVANERELKSVGQEIAALKKQLKDADGNGNEELNMAKEALEAANASVEEMAANIRDLDERVKVLRITYEDRDNQMTETLEKLHSADVLAESLQADLVKARAEKPKLEEDVNEHEEAIEIVTEGLAKAEEKLAEYKYELDGINQKIAEDEQELKQFHLRRGRREVFDSEAAKNTWLEKQIKTFNQDRKAGTKVSLTLLYRNSTNTFMYFQVIDEITEELKKAETELVRNRLLGEIKNPKIVFV